MRWKAVTVPSSLVGLILLSGLVARAAGAESAPFPRLVCDEPIFHYGAVDNRTPVQHVFELRNEGTAPLAIQRVVSGCGCTRTELSTNVVAPRGVARLAVTASLLGRSGQRNVSLFLHSNDPVHPILALQFVGTAVALVDVQPPQFTFDVRPDDGELRRYVAITNQSTSPLHIRSWDAPAPVRMVELTTNEDGRSYGLAVTLSSNAAAAATNLQLRVKTDHPQYEEIAIPVVIRRLGEVLVMPEEIVLVDRMQNGQAETRYVLVRSTRGRAFKIVGVESTAPDLPVALHKSGPDWHHIKVGPVVPNRDLDGAILRIETDLPGGERIDVPIRVQAAGLGELR